MSCCFGRDGCVAAIRNAGTLVMGEAASDTVPGGPAASEVSETLPFPSGKAGAGQFTRRRSSRLVSWRKTGTDGVEKAAGAGAEWTAGPSGLPTDNDRVAE